MNNLRSNITPHVDLIDMSGLSVDFEPFFKPIEPGFLLRWIDVGNWINQLSARRHPYVGIHSPHQIINFIAAIDTTDELQHSINWLSEWTVTKFQKGAIGSGIKPFESRTVVFENLISHNSD